LEILNVVDGGKLSYCRRKNVVFAKSFLPSFFSKKLAGCGTESHEKKDAENDGSSAEKKPLFCQKSCSKSTNIYSL